jgi:hypothetical protein
MPTAVAKDKKETIYWSTPAKLRLAGLEPEQRSVVGLKPDKSLVFHNHIFRTSDPKIKKFIESSKLFGRKDGIEVVTEDQIENRKAAAIEAKKRAFDEMMDRGKLKI